MAEDAGRDALSLLASCGRYARWLHDLARPHLKSRVVEVGAGIGTQSALLVGDPAAHHVLLTDADPGRVEALARMFASNERVEAAPWRLPEPFPSRAFEPESFVLWNVLEHVEDDEAALREMARALPTGGTVVVFAPAGRGLMGAFDRRIGHHRRYGRRELSSKARRAGLEPVVEKTVNLAGGLGWFVSLKFMGARALGGGKARVFDRLVPLFRLWEDRLPVPFGSSVLMAARRR